MCTAAPDAQWMVRNSSIDYGKLLARKPNCKQSITDMTPVAEYQLYTALHTSGYAATTESEASVEDDAFLSFDKKLQPLQFP